MFEDYMTMTEFAFSVCVGTGPLFRNFPWKFCEMLFDKSSRRNINPGSTVS